MKLSQRTLTSIIAGGIMHIILPDASTQSGYKSYGIRTDVLLAGTGGSDDHNSLLNTHNLTTDIDHAIIANSHNLTTDIDHNLIANTHNLTSDIDHNLLQNSHNLTDDIDHNLITNSHNLTTDINHDLLYNYNANEHIDWTNASANFHTTGIAQIDNATTISGTLTVNGDIVQNGSSYITYPEEVRTNNDFIYLREGAVGGLGAGQYAGFEAVLYDGANNGQLVIDAQGWARVGDVGDLNKVATMEENPTNGYFGYWDSANNYFATRQLDASDIIDFDVEVANNSAVLVNTAKVSSQWISVGNDIYYENNVGIGSFPSKTLDLYTDGSICEIRLGEATGNYNTVLSMYSANSKKWELYNDETNNDFKIDSINGNVAIFDNTTKDVYFSNKVGIGTSTPKAGVDYIGTNGMALFSDTPTANSTKTSRLGTYHYNTDIDPFIGLLQISNNTDNQLRLGGGTGLGNAATFISFHTAPNNTTKTGSECARFNGSGYFGIGTGSSIPEKLSILEGNLDLNKGDGVDFPKINLKSTAITTTIGTITRDVTNALLFEANTTTRDFTFRNTSGDLVTIKGSGGVGIGKTPSLGKLDVNGTGYFEDTLTAHTTIEVLDENGANGAQMQGLTGGGARFTAIGANSMQFYTNGVNRLEISNTGAATFSNTVTATDFIIA